MASNIILRVMHIYVYKLEDLFIFIIDYREETFH